MTKRLVTPPFPIATADGATSPMRRRALASLGGLAVMASGCGGSGGTGDLAGVGSGGTGAAFGFGMISGFGSIIVNGIKYDDSQASVTDDLGNRRELGELGLGMIVEIRGSADDSTSLGTANSVRILSELKGPVTRVTPSQTTPGTGELVVLGTTVRAMSTTFWQDASGLGGVVDGQVVEVWGFADRASNTITATRIEIKQASDNTATRLRGIVTELVPGIRLRVGGQQEGAGSQDFTLANATVAAGVRVGELVKVQYTPSGNTKIATKVEVDSSAVLSNETRVRAEGRISQFTSKSSFKLEGLNVDASSASFSDGLESQLANGARVRVEGQMSGSKLKASVVRFRDDAQSNSGSGSSGSGSSGSGSGSSNSGSSGGSQSSGSDDYGDEVNGVIVRFAGKESFTVKDRANREFNFDGSSATGKDGGPLPSLGIGSPVQVKFTVQAFGLLKANQIRLDS